METLLLLHPITEAAFDANIMEVQKAIEPLKSEGAHYMAHMHSHIVYIHVHNY